jgi:predicted DNA binding CopG/RHH family protein
MPKLIKEKNQRITIRMSDSMMTAIKAESKETGTSLSFVVCKALQSYFNLP